METISARKTDLATLLAKVKGQDKSIAIIDDQGNEYLLSRRRRRASTKVPEYNPVMTAKIELSRQQYAAGQYKSMTVKEFIAYAQKMRDEADA